MKTGISTVTLFVFAMFLTTPALADDVEDVKAAVLGYFAALNGGDANALIQYRVPRYSAFAPGGQLLNRAPSLEAQKRNFQDGVNQGIRRNLQIRHLEVTVYGNAAVVTGYLTGTENATDGTPRQVNWQRSGFWTKQDGKWKEAHHHRGPLTAAP